MDVRKVTRRTLLAGAAFGIGLAGGCDYEQWRGLGAGGIPNTPAGWLQVSWLRTQKREARDPGVFRPLVGRPGDGRWLGPIPHRQGPRPSVAPHPVPHRQTDQPGSLRGRVAALDHFDARAAREPAVIGYRRSFFEKHSDAITVVDLARAPEVIRVTHGEAAHIHPTDGSMHMIFSPTDAITVLETGWGERHPLAGDYPNMPLPYVFVYSPRTVEEADVVRRLLDASAGYASSAPQLSA
ncbi:luciferase family protein [Allokutzneria sp. NRRL B-24872]|uniref:luciferase domain-containing protein n=1 Tax=Allokutzneria sp. NRRL B-24872 TaxID=1137961 RepID=UPI000A3823A4|nr:luciferase family protein [Allokutzneria sp. NRRL B-24872]